MRQLNQQSAIHVLTSHVIETRQVVIYQRQPRGIYEYLKHSSDDHSVGSFMTLDSPAVEEKVVPTLLYTAAFRSDAGLAYVHLADAALKIAPTPVFRHRAPLTCSQTEIIQFQ